MTSPFRKSLGSSPVKSPVRGPAPRGPRGQTWPGRLARGLATARLRRLVIGGLVTLGLAGVLRAEHASAQEPVQLSYSRGFLVTGDYAVGGIDLQEGANPIEAGFSTAPIAMSGVPANADILAAYLFWETVTTGGGAWETEAAGVKFRGFDLDITNVLSVKRTTQPSVGAACFGSGSLEMHMFRADVLRFLPVKVDSAGKSTGKRLVNSADLAAQGLEPHMVTLPVRDGNAVPESAGASLVVVYRDPNPNAPLKKIVIYDGNAIKPDVDTALNLTIKGIYGSSASQSARITHILSSGQPNHRLHISFAGDDPENATLVASDPFASGPASQRWWANPTQIVSPSMPGASDSTYGEIVQTSIYHSPSSGSYDCVASGAVVFSAAVADVDHDGLPDALEDAAGPLTDADDRVLPNLAAMDAGSDQPDIFIEVNAMRAEAGTIYGSADAPYSATEPIKTDLDGHNHMPTPYALKLVGDAFATHGIRVHFDVGDTDAYHALDVVEHGDFVDDYTSTVADDYLVPSEWARGGEQIWETACDPEKPACHFPAFPGTVPWKLGLQAHRDAPVDDAGNEIVPVEQGADGVSFEYPDMTPAAWNGRRRFDPERRGLFKYLLYAHARGNPKSLPCLVDGQPAPYLDGLLTDTPSCNGMENPDFDPLGYHVPTSASGIAELPGGNFMVTMGFWDEFVGRPFARASTTFHELGHTLALFHGGPETRVVNPAAGTWQPGAVIWGDPTTPTWVEANCKPNYLSSMSYLFQIHGLFDDSDEIHLDYSWSARGNGGDPNRFTEGVGMLPDGLLWPAPAALAPAYQTAWFAPANSPLALSLGVSAAKRYCSGERWDPLNPPAPMARVHSESSDATIDWNGDEAPNSAGIDSDDDGVLDAPQDVNFDKAIGTLDGFSDWNNVRLNQTGAVVTGITAGSAEGVFFDNSGKANGVFFDNSGVFFDQSGVWFDNSGVWFDNAGGVFFDNSGVVNSGVFFDNSGVWFDNSGVWFDNAGGVWFDNAGGVFFDNAGGVFFDNSGVFFDNAGGVFFDNSGQEITFEEAQSFGRGRPHRVEACVKGEASCTPADSGDEDYHKVEVRFEQLQVGGITAYEIQRKRDGASPGSLDADFATVGTVLVHLSTFTDPTELPDDEVFTYRVRGRSTDEYGDSGWSRSVTVTAVNEAPVATNDSYSVAGGSVLTVLAPDGVLANDTEDDDSPSISRAVRAMVSGPSHGTLSLSANGSFTYTPDSGFVGEDSFTYVADNGPWSGDPAVRLSPASNVATVTISVTNDPPTCDATLTPSSVLVGSTTLLTPGCSDPNGDPLTVIGAVVESGGGTTALTGGSSFTYTAPATAGSVQLSFTVRDVHGETATGSASIAVTLPPPYGFVNVQNLPPPNKSKFRSGSTIPTKWQWTRNGVAVNTAGQAIVSVYSCAGDPLGTFTAQNPGNGNSFSFDPNSNTWSFNWKLLDLKGANLPAGFYILQIQNSVTKQIDPNTGNRTCGGQTGALVEVR